MATYEVWVGNVGRVRSGTSKRACMRAYAEYVLLSKQGYGRAGGESVTLMKDDEPIKEFQGVWPTIEDGSE